MVDDELHEDLRNIAAECTEQVHKACPEDTFKWLFWDQQEKSSSVRNSKSMRWHPLFIKWCIYLRHLSGSAYDFLRESGFWLYHLKELLETILITYRQPLDFRMKWISN